MRFLSLSTGKLWAYTSKIFSMGISILIWNPGLSPRNPCKEYPRSMHQHHLADIDPSLVSWYFLDSLLYFFDGLVCAHCEDCGLGVRFVGYAGEVYVFLTLNSNTGFPSFYAPSLPAFWSICSFHIKPIHPIPRNETWVIIQPLYASDFTDVGFEVYSGAIGRVEFVDTDVVLVCTGEEMTSIERKRISLHPWWEFLESLKLLENVHHSDFICETNNDVETRGMESKWKAFIWETSQISRVFYW